MNITKEEFSSYVNNHLSTDRKVLIDKYLLDHPLERKALEGAQEFQLTDSFDALLDEVDESLGLKVQQGGQIDEGLPKKTGKVINLPYKWLLGVAAATILFVLVRSYGIQGETSLAEYFDAYPDVMTNIVRGEPSVEEEAPIFVAMRFYNQAEYQKSSELLTALSNEHPTDQNISFYLGVSDFAQGKYDSSLEKFEMLTTHKSNFQYDDGALWYRALCLLHLDRHEEAKPILNQIATTTHYKKQQALDLLKNL